MTSPRLGYLRHLEAESIHIIREAAAEFSQPVMLFSAGKDSSVLLHLARKAFHPARVPFPLLHIDTGWKFRDMIAFRDRCAQELQLRLIVHTNTGADAQSVTPFSHGSRHYTGVMKTQALVQALAIGGFDAALGGARRDEEQSRAKERIFSFRDRFQQWDPRDQRPELWHLSNTRLGAGETMRVFPLSNWTEFDVWLYIHLEQIAVVPLYFAASRPVVARNGILLMIDDDRFPLAPGEEIEQRVVRFRTLGCYPLTGAVESACTTVPGILREMAETRTSERRGRLIDFDEDGSMEQKKREGYF